MTRADFMTRLRRGLAGMQATAIAEISDDYENHFVDGLANGRTEAEVAQALGNPDRLARELRAEAGLRRWEEEKTPSAAGGALWALLGLGAIDLFILFVVLMPVLGILFTVLMLAVAGIVGGAGVLAVGPFTDPPGGAATAIFAGIGLMSLSVTVGSLLALMVVGLVNALVWYVRLHFRLLKPAIESQS